MVVSRCRGIGSPSGIPSSGLCFCWLPIFVVIVWPVPRGVSVIPCAVSLRVSISQSTGILGIPLPALLSNITTCDTYVHIYISGMDYYSMVALSKPTNSVVRQNRTHAATHTICGLCVSRRRCPVGTQETACSFNGTVPESCCPACLSIADRERLQAKHIMSSSIRTVNEVSKGL